MNEQLGGYVARDGDVARGGEVARCGVTLYAVHECGSSQNTTNFDF